MKEITRAFVAFQLPFANLGYSERYREWRLHAPYPNLIRGVYIMTQGYLRLDDASRQR